MITKYKFSVTVGFIVIGLHLMCGSALLFSQSVRTDYFLNNSETRSSMNPAFHPNQGFMGFPFLSEVGVGVYTNFLNLDHLTFKRNGERVTFLHPSVSSADFLSELPDQSYVDLNFNYKALAFGWKDKKNGYWTIDLGMRALANIIIPRSAFELMKNGFSENENETKAYSIQNIQAAVTAFAEVGAGYSKGFLDNDLNVGAKVKLLFGIANMDMRIDHLNVSTGNGEWIAQSKATLDGVLLGIKPEYDKKNQFNGIDNHGMGISGLGAGLDIGGAYTFLDKRAHVSLAFTDIGFISWTKNNSMHLATPETEVRINSEQKDFNNDNNFDDRLSTIYDDLKETINFKETGQKVAKTTLRTGMNAGIAYEVWKQNLSLGALFSSYMGRGHTTNELTFSANYNPFKVRWFSAALSYSVIHNRFNTVGFAMHLTPRKGIHLFLGSDFLVPHVNKDFIPTSSKASNFQVGISFPIVD